MEIKRTIAIFLAVCFLLSITSTAVNAQANVQKIDMAQKIVTGSTSATSTNGKGVLAEIYIPAKSFMPGKWVHIVPIGWDFTFNYGDHPILKQNLWLVQQKSNSVQYQRVKWATARSDGSVLAGYSVEYGSQNQDNPFTVNVDYAAFGPAYEETSR